MIQIRKSEERGKTKLDWLDSRFTFSFDQYYDPEHVQFRSLRVLNEDVIAPGGGFGTHPHRDMEILTWVLEGALEHRDSTGSRGVIRPGDLQKMSAGTGVTHSEKNASSSIPVHLLQIWIHPDRKGLKPGYEQLTFADKDLRGNFNEIAGPAAPITIHQDARLSIARLSPGNHAEHEIQSGRHAWVQIARGALKMNGETLSAGDGAAVSDESQLEFIADKGSEILLFDLA
ncbi:MAG: pirin family protein [Candidatus Acidiferrales bacterium]